jgi:hypothetical protein
MPKMLTFERVLALRWNICGIDVGRRDARAEPAAQKPNVAA